MTDTLAGLAGQQAFPVDGAGAPAGVVVRGAVARGAFQVLLAGWDSVRPPAAGKLAELHHWRLGQKNFSLVAAVRDRYGDVWLAGPGVKDQPVGPLKESEAARMLQAALDEPSGPLARKRIADLLRAHRAGDPVLGLYGEGLFANHYLTKVLPDDPMWQQAVQRAGSWLGLRGHTLIEAMGFAIMRNTGKGLVLTARGTGGGGIVR